MEEAPQQSEPQVPQRPAAEIMMAADADSWFARRVGQLAQLAAQHEADVEVNRRAVPPNLIPTRMSAKNEQWLADRQAQARAHRLAVAADQADRGLPTRAR